MAFVLPKGIIHEIEKRLRSFLERHCRHGCLKVAWDQVCKLIEEGGLGVRDILALNSAMMSQRLWEVIQNSSSSIWVQWVYSVRLRGTTIWTVSLTGGSWSWRKMLRLRTHMLPNVTCHIGDGHDCIKWGMGRGQFDNTALTNFFRPPGPKVGWSSLFLGHFKIPRNAFTLWLVILGRLFTLDKPWLRHLDGMCILCSDGLVETHQHLFFDCQYAQRCISSIRRSVRFPWPYWDWTNGISWASSRWREKHVVNAAYRALLASLVYHVWQERNRRRFQSTERTPSVLGHCILEECKQRIISAELSNSISTHALYRL
ncbi:UNVERIFIED_CONTAM: hypothetical protein Slati_3901700 [Sesamum latifolium]|uniref:Reverse transcriptase zinc-binding domain-containing protein n=1 Tax=Sesamum latifolium TaxID=2727402 RepID=A0AAW2TMZ7_9LAMI